MAGNGRIKRQNGGANQGHTARRLSEEDTSSTCNWCSSGITSILRLFSYFAKRKCYNRLINGWNWTLSLHLLWNKWSRPNFHYRNNPRISVSISSLSMNLSSKWEQVYCWIIKITGWAQFISLELSLRGGASEDYASEGQWFNPCLQLPIEASFNMALTLKWIPVLTMNECIHKYILKHNDEFWI